MINTGGALDNVQDQPEQAQKVEEEIFNMTKPEKEEIAKWEEASGDKVPWHQIPIEGAPFRADINATSLWSRHHHKHNGDHHRGHHGHYRQQPENEDEPQEDEPEHKKRPKHHPYKEWLDKLPYMTEKEAYRQA